MNRPAFNQPSDLWLLDGSLRDVYVQNASLNDWEALLALAREYPREYVQDGISLRLTDSSAIFHDREHSHLLSIKAGSVNVNCHFFVSEEIELDIDPREVMGPDEHNAVLLLLERLASATQKDLLVTAENSPNVTLLRYQPATRHWHVYELAAKRDA